MYYRRNRQHRLFSSCLQEFSLLQLDDVADQRVNIIGFSVFNKTHPFFQDFVISLNRSWQENCDHAPFAGTPVSASHKGFKSSLPWFNATGFASKSLFLGPVTYCEIKRLNDFLPCQKINARYKPGPDLLYKSDRSKLAKSITLLAFVNVAHYTPWPFQWSVFSTLRKQPCSAGAGFLHCLRQGRTIRSSGGRQTADFTWGLHFRGESSRQIALPFIDLQLHRLYKRAECDSSSPVTAGCVDIKQNPSCVVLIIKMYLISKWLKSPPPNML